MRNPKTDAQSLLEADQLLQVFQEVYLEVLPEISDLMLIARAPIRKAAAKLRTLPEC